MSNKKAIEKPFTNVELASFCGQLSLILESGISAQEGLTLMYEDSQSEDEKAFLGRLSDQLLETGSLYESMKETGLFPSYLLQMVQIGETTGNLDNVMSSLQIHYDREDRIRRNIRNAVLYPAIIIAMMVAVIVVILVKVMPIFRQVFLQLGTEMTGISHVLVNIGETIGRYAFVFTALAVILVAFILFLVYSDSGRRLAGRIAYALPFTRSVYEKTAVCRFAGGMALTIRSGLDPEQGLELVSGLNEDSHFQSKLEACGKEMQEHGDLARAMLSSGIFTGMYARMTSIGAKTGSIEQVLEQIADLYQDEIDNRIHNLISVLEPTLVVILSVIIGIILMSVMLPLMGILSGM